jgi:hypothetical protein
MDYVPRPYPGKITAFRSRKLYVGERDPRTGWAGSLAPGDLEVHTLRAYPAGMLIEPFVRELGEKLNACLEGAREEHAAVGNAAP